jgi:hypothetical protein
MSNPQHDGVSDRREPNRRDLIETAMGRAPADARAVTPDFVDSRTMTFRREQDQALKLRLEQLETAQSSAAPPVMSPISLSDKVPVTSTPRRPLGSYFLLPVTALASLLGGAAFMWLVLGGATAKLGDITTASPLPATHGASQISVPVVLSGAKSESAVAAVLAGASGAVDNSDIQVRDLVEGWRQAWAQRDVEAYLGYYSQQFVPANGQTISAWRKARQQNLSSRSSIQVGIKDVRVERIDDDRIQATFFQDYASDTYQESARPKTLMFERADKKWLISGERQGN